MATPNTPRPQASLMLFLTERSICHPVCSVVHDNCFFLFAVIGFHPLIDDVYRRTLKRCSCANFTFSDYRGAGASYWLTIRVTRLSAGLKSLPSNKAKNRGDNKTVCG